ncbi:hypothetical protein CaCOL14_007548 [Colletotrichum acutatum]
MQVPPADYSLRRVRGIPDRDGPTGNLSSFLICNKREISHSLGRRGKWHVAVFLVAAAAAEAGPP